MKLPFKTLPELFQYFSHEEKARDFLEKMDGLTVVLSALFVAFVVLIVMLT